MKYTVLVLLSLLILSCEKKNDDNFELIDFKEIELECVNIATRSSGSLKVRIDTQEEYDSLYYYMFTKILEDWLNANYGSLISGLSNNYLGADPEDYDSILMNDYIYNFLPYKGTYDCEHPLIDFESYTLLGQSISVASCSIPKIETELLMDNSNKELIFRLNIETYGFCEMGFGFYVWILVDKLTDDIEVKYQTEENNLIE